MSTGTVVGAGTSVFINEIHYDNDGTDTGEAVEVAGPAGTSLSGWSIVLYNGNGGATYDTINLSGTILDQQNGFGTLSFSRAGIQNGAPDGMALVDPANTVIQFLSYEGVFTAVDGPAVGMTSVDIGVTEVSTTPVGYSMQLAGTGKVYEDYIWQAAAANTFGTINTGQFFQAATFTPTFTATNTPTPIPPTATPTPIPPTATPIPPPPSSGEMFINELHYDNRRGDVGEAVEVAGTAGTDLTGWSIVLYNGNNGASYGTINLSGIVPNQQNGMGTLSFAFAGIQNGPDGLALVDPANTVIQFLSYEGVFAAADGPAAGQTSTDIGVSEGNSTQVGESMQLVGTGRAYADFTWQAPAADSFGAINAGQTFTPIVVNPGDVVVNEIMKDPSAVLDSSGEWFELVNTTGNPIDINGWTLQDAGTDIHVINNGGPLTIPAGGYLVLGNNGDTFTNGGVSVDYVYGASWFLGNSTDEIILINDLAVEIDNVAYDSVSFPDPTGASLELIDAALDNNIGSNWCIATAPYGDGDAGTPGGANDCGAPPPPTATPLPPTATPTLAPPTATPIGPTPTSPPPTATPIGPTPTPPPTVVTTFGVCGDPATPLSLVQGSGLTSPINGTTNVVVEAVVVGDYQGTSGLNGFYLQEEDFHTDGDAATSEGLFIYDAAFGTPVVVGDVVRVQGNVTESFTLTELSSISNVVVCSSGASVTPASVTLPVASLNDWEAYEGMVVNIAQTLYVTENYSLGRYGEVSVSVGGRLFNPTNVTTPGTLANDMQAANDLRRILLDDGSTTQNPASVPYLLPNNTLRSGDTTPGVTGVLDYRYNFYRLQPFGTVTFTSVNQRPVAPANVGGTIKVASFNVLNYFTTIDNGALICGPSGGLGCRGADTQSEFTRQRDKIISAIVAMDADVIGLMELENNTTTAIQNLVDGLNAAAGAGTYDFVNTGTIGSDAIRVALIYKPANVTPVGPYAILDSSVDPNFIDTKNRPALAQTFEDNVFGGRLTVAVNHLKSKGSVCDALGDPDTGDGQGNCNLTRTAAAQALVDWLATDPTGSGDPDFLIIGDLNAYAKEDPITAIKNAGYTDLIDTFLTDPYSYVFMGQAGYLDHALANASLTAQVTGVTEWHINGDEPSALDYNNYNQAFLYNPDPYRSSDHDPVIIGVCLAPATCP